MNEIFAIILPGMMYFWVLFIGQGPLQEVLQEKETYTLSRLLAAPVTLSQFLISKMLRSFALCSLVLGLLILISAGLFGLKWGNPLGVAGVVAVCALSMTGLVAFTYSLAKTKEQANAISSMVLMVFALVGGSMFPFESLPRFMQAVGRFTPNRWGVLTLQGLTQSKPMAELVTPLISLIVLGVVGCLAAFYLFRRQLAKGRGP